MGRSRCCATPVDARIDDCIAAEDGSLVTLTAEELRLDVDPVAIPPTPAPCRAWTRIGSTPLRVDAVVLRWTPCTVGISFTIGEQTHRAWVWSGAVTT